MSRIKAVIFDLGDVLFAWNTTTDTLISSQTLRAITQSAVWFEYECGKITTEECYSQLSVNFDVPVSELETAFLQCTNALEPIKIMEDLIRELAREDQVRLYLMSNVCQQDFDRLRSRVYVWDLFDRIFASGYVGLRKPDLEFYEHVLQEIGTAPAETVFVDDRIENVNAAQQVGIVGIHFQDPELVCQRLKMEVNASST